MTKQKKSMVVLTIFVTFIAMTVFLTEQVNAGNLEPSGPPARTMKTLDEIPPTWSQNFRESDRRFEFVLYNAAVLDKETGLVWARNANINGFMTWEEAVNYCRNLTIGYRKGWRLPSVEELASLLDMSVTSSPKLSTGYEYFFNSVKKSYYYWSSSGWESWPGSAWGVKMGNGDVNGNIGKDNTSCCVWPVRGGSPPTHVPHIPAVH